MSEVKVNKISPRSGTDVILGDSEDTFTIPSGATIANYGTATGFAAGNRNMIINGNFDVWQRGTSFTGADDWTADRWLIHANGTSPSTTRQTFTVGQTDVPNFPTYYLRYNAGTTPAAVGELNQRVEDVGGLGGKEITISLWAKAASSTPNLGLAIIQNFGSGGSAANVQLNNATLWTLSTSWQKFTHTITIDSISGKTVGASSYTQFRIKMAQDAINKDISQVQVEVSPTATPFEHKTYGQELAACKRYLYAFRKDGGGSTAIGTGIISGTTTISFIHLTLPVEMRTTPTLTVTDPTSSTISEGAADRAVTSQSIGPATKNNCLLSVTHAAGTAAGTTVRYSLADTILLFSAEL